MRTFKTDGFPLRASLTLFALVLSTTSAAAGQTWWVDDDGGTGIDFTQIQPAIDAAQSGDLIVVHAGSYRGFSLQKGLTILGTGAGNTSVVRGTVMVTGVPGFERAVLSGLSLRPMVEYFDVDNQQNVLASPLALGVDSNLGPVILDNLEFDNPLGELGPRVSINECADARLYQCVVKGYGSFSFANGMDGVQVVNSHVEVVDSYLRGGDGGADWYGGPGGLGGDGLDASNSIVSVHRSTCLGGDGGDAGDDNTAVVIGGDGGHGLRLDGGSVALIGGIPSDRLEPGPGGIATCWLSCTDGAPGFGLLLLGASVARHSGVTIVSESVTPGSVASPAVPADPTLHRTGLLKAGDVQTFSITGPPGEAVTFHFGRKAVVLPGPLPGMDNLVTHDRSIQLGPIPPTGELQFNFTIPTGLPAGFTLFAQAEITSASGPRLTSSLPLVVRLFP